MLEGEGLTPIWGGELSPLTHNTDFRTGCWVGEGGGGRGRLFSRYSGLLPCPLDKVPFTCTFTIVSHILTEGVSFCDMCNVRLSMSVCVCDSAWSYP